MSVSVRSFSLLALCAAAAACAAPVQSASRAVAPTPAPTTDARPGAASRPAAAAQQATDDEPLVTDRPDFTESPSVVPRGRIQLEAGETFGREDGSNYLSLGEALFRVGLNSRFELRVAANSYGVVREQDVIGTGFEDASVGLKYALTDTPRGWWPQMAVIGAVSLPTGTRAMSAQRTLPEVKFISAWELSDRVGFATNLNWARATRDGLQHNEYSASGSVAYSLTERVGLYAEAFAFRERMQQLVKRDYVNGGVTILLTNDLQLDIRAGRGPSPSRGDFFTGLGLSHRW
jgi:hypothetical protein